MTLLLGVDIYDGQGYPDWSKVVASGVSFAIIKATESFHNVQDTLQYNRTNAPAAGISPLGLYHFARPESGNPEAQADHFCDVIGELGPDEFVALDIETGSQSTWPDFIERWFGRVFERMGGWVPNCLYQSLDPASRMPASLAKYPLWGAGYGVNNGQVPNWPGPWSAGGWTWKG